MEMMHFVKICWQTKFAHQLIQKDNTFRDKLSKKTSLPTLCQLKGNILYDKKSVIKGGWLILCFLLIGKKNAVDSYKEEKELFALQKI